jgi:anti-anti-sigma factor
MMTNHRPPHDRLVLVDTDLPGPTIGAAPLVVQSPTIPTISAVVEEAVAPSSSSPHFSLSFTAGRPWDRLAIGGDLDSFTAPLLADALAVLPFSGWVELDLGEVRFLSLHGLTVLQHAQRQASHRGGRLSVVAASAAARRVLDLVPPSAS